MQVDGTETVDVTVYCTHQRRSIGADVCAACERWAGMSVHRNAESSLMLCADAPPREMGDDQDPIIASIMTRDVVCVRAEVTIERVIATLIEAGVSGLPVVDERGHPMGVVSQTDVLTRGRYLRAEDEGTTAEDILTPIAFTLPEHAPVSRAAALMAYEGIHRIPIVDAEGAVVGLVSALDIARWVAEEAGWLKR